MPFEPLADAPTSDVGFVASGATLDECFLSAGEALLAVMVGEPNSVCSRTRRQAHLQRDELDMLLVAFLEEIIFYKDAESLFLRPESVSVVEVDGAWRLQATLTGEPIDAQVHMLSADVKAVTLHRLAVRKANGGWQATVVLDV